MLAERVFDEDGLFPDAVVIVQQQPINLRGPMLIGIGLQSYRPALVSRSKHHAIEPRIGDMWVNLAPACAIKVRQGDVFIAVFTIAYHHAAINPADPEIIVGGASNDGWRDRER